MSVIRAYGLTLEPAQGMVQEFINLGALDVYLREALPQTVKTVDLVEAATSLANAVFHLVMNFKILQINISSIAYG